MADNAHDVGLMTLIVDGVAHGFAIDGHALVAAGVDVVPSLQSAVELCRLDADQYIADDRQARHAVMAVSPAASEAPARFLSEALGPIGDGLVSSHAAQGCRGSNGQDRIEAMSAALGPLGQQLRIHRRKLPHLCQGGGRQDHPSIRPDCQQPAIGPPWKLPARTRGRAP